MQEEIFQKYNLFNYEDEFISNSREGMSRWVARLNSGHTIYQDDERPNVVPLSAWERLGIYCNETGDYIIGMYLQFRSHIEHLPSDADGYYFVKSILGSLHNPDSYHFYIAGTLTGTRERGTILVREFKIPELIEISNEVRNPQEAGICLISKK